MMARGHRDDVSRCAAWGVVLGQKGDVFTVQLHVSFDSYAALGSEALVDLARGYLALALGTLTLVVVLRPADGIAAAPADAADAGVGLVAGLERSDVFGPRHKLDKSMSINE
jgi:hypothetical protein